MYKNWNGEALPIESVKVKLKFSNKTMICDSKLERKYGADAVDAQLDMVKFYNSRNELLAVRC